MSRNYYKKNGFTLIELIAVMAIIGVLAMALVPKVSKYMTEAKKVKVVAQARTAIVAAEMYDSKNTAPISTDTYVKDFGTKNVVPAADLDDFMKETSMIQELSLLQCQSIVNDGKDFTIGADGKVDVASVQ